MSHLRNLFENRTSDVLHSTSDTVLGNLKIFFEFLNDNLLLKSILEELEKNLPDPEPIVAHIRSIRRIILPSSYLEKVKTCLSILQHMIQKDEEPWKLMSFVLTDGNTDYLTAQALREFFVPVQKYIDERIRSIDSFQYLITRFKLKSEWFEKEILFDLYNGDTTRGESNLDRVLRGYLFDQGIDFPFSKPASPSGEVDVLSLIERKPIPLEIKVFDGAGRSQAYILQGFRQAFSYANDYGEPTAYLVIFNVSEHDLLFKLSLPDVPPRLVIGNKTIYIFVINLRPCEDSASRRDLNPFIIDEKSLLET